MCEPGGRAGLTDRRARAPRILRARPPSWPSRYR